MTDLAFSIGEVAAMLGVSPHTIRAWERRHFALQPTRTASGQRRYSTDDVDLLRQIKFERHANGLSMRLATLTAKGLLAAETEGRPAPADTPATVGGDERQLDVVANLVSEIVVVIDQDGCVRDANTAFVRFVDSLPGRVRGTRFTDFVDPFDRAKGVQLHTSERQRHGWELHLRGGRRPSLFAFDSWPVTTPAGRRIILVGAERTPAVRTTADHDLRQGDPATGPVPHQVRLLFERTPDPARVFDLLQPWLDGSRTAVGVVQWVPTRGVVRHNQALRAALGSAAGAGGLLELPEARDGSTEEVLTRALDLAVRSGRPQAVERWAAPSQGDRASRWDIGVIPAHQPGAATAHLLLWMTEAMVGRLPPELDRLAGAVAAISGLSERGEVYAAAGVHGADLVPGASLLVGWGDAASRLRVLHADGLWSEEGPAHHLRLQAAQEVMQSGGRLEVRRDAGAEPEHLRALPIPEGELNGAGGAGVVAFARRAPEPFTERERQLMDEFVDRVTLALRGCSPPPAS